jgi:4-diphosphocytidyl-2-C-methyl-D-erythritol kinase
MVVFPNAKVNLGLQIRSKRPDGYHNLETAFLPVPGFHDALELLPGEEKQLELHCSGLNIPGDPNQNLLTKAYALLSEGRTLPGLRAWLYKAMPMGAGLGGGSADAAFFLRAANEVLNLDISLNELETIASQLGADCAFFIRNNPAIGTGRGDELQAFEPQLSGQTIVLVFPGFPISTAEAYQGAKPNDNRPHLSELLALPKKEWQQHIHNDFEDHLFPIYPVLSEIKQTLLNCGAWYAAMSGSGSTLYGLFESPPPTLSLPGNCTFFSCGL